MFGIDLNAPDKRKHVAVSFAGTIALSLAATSAPAIEAAGWLSPVTAFAAAWPVLTGAITMFAIGWAKEVIHDGYLGLGHRSKGDKIANGVGCAAGIPFAWVAVEYAWWLQ